MSEWQWASLRPHKVLLQEDSELPKQILDGNLEYLWRDHQHSRSHFAALLGKIGGDPDDSPPKIQVSKKNYFGHHPLPQTETGGGTVGSNTAPPSSTSSPSWRTAGGSQLAALVAQQSVANCDLPPPSSEASAVTKQSKNSGSGDVFGEALCRSQSRAREAESLALRALQEKEEVMHLFLREASLTLAYRQWLVLLQAENLLLLRMVKSTSTLHQPSLKRRCHGQSSRRRSALAAAASFSDVFLRCTVAFAVGLGLASAGLMLGWGMGWIMFAL